MYRKTPKWDEKKNYFRFHIGRFNNLPLIYFGPKKMIIKENGHFSGNLWNKINLKIFHQFFLLDLQQCIKKKVSQFREGLKK